MTYKPSQAYYKEFCTSSPSTGAAANADSLPVATANHNGTDDSSFTLTVTNIDTGRYKITGTVPVGYVSGDVVNVSVAATCSAIAGKSIVDTFNIDSKLVSDLHDFNGGAVASVTAAVTVSGNVTVGGYATGQDPATLVIPAFLKYDLSTITGEANHSPINALRAARSFSISGTTLTVFKEDGSTAAYTMTLTTNSAASPITAAA